MKLPRIVKKLRVMMAWTLDLLFGRDIEQMITLRDVEELSERWTRHSTRRRSLAHDASAAIFNRSTRFLDEIDESYGPERAKRVEVGNESKGF